MGHNRTRCIWDEHRRRFIGIALLCSTMRGLKIVLWYEFPRRGTAWSTVITGPALVVLRRRRHFDNDDGDSSDFRRQEKEHY